MLQIKCPECESGIMSDLHTFQGWGKDGTYVCDSCGHLKNIYEGPTVGPYIFFILFEVFLFVISTHISFYEYIVYGVILLFLIYRVYAAIMGDRRIKTEYPILGNAEDDFEPNSMQKSVINDELKKVKKSYKFIKVGIAFFIVISYSIMFYTEEHSLEFSDYVLYAFLIVVLPLWLIFTKFEK
ncbi:MAG: hypothetical protein GQ474_01905 [Sulfurimonas sp.]|nr:hypothetical protein [Sulfurimonas sp.]